MNNNFIHGSVYFFCENDDHFVLGCRGSKSFTDWFCNIIKSVAEEKFIENLPFNTHPGFFDKAKEIYDSIKNYIRNSNKPIRCIGHSLGGSIASIVSLFIAKDFGIDRVKLTAFGSAPCIFPKNEEAKLLLELMKPNMLQFINHYDIVPRLHFSFFDHISKTIINENEWTLGFEDILFTPGRLLHLIKEGGIYERNPKSFELLVPILPQCVLNHLLNNDKHGYIVTLRSLGVDIVLREE